MNEEETNKKSKVKKLSAAFSILMLLVSVTYFMIGIDFFQNSNDFTELAIGLETGTISYEEGTVRFDELKKEQNELEEIMYRPWKYWGWKAGSVLGEKEEECNNSYTIEYIDNINGTSIKLNNIVINNKSALIITHNKEAKEAFFTSDLMMWDFNDLICTDLPGTIFLDHSNCNETVCLYTYGNKTVCIYLDDLNECDLNEWYVYRSENNEGKATVGKSWGFTAGPAY